MGTEVNKKFIQTIYLPGSELEKLGLKTGDGLDDIALYKEIPKQFLCDDIAEKAALSTYFNVRKLIEKYEGENILFIWDEESVVSDDNFYFCINEEYKRDRLTYFMSSGVSAEKVSQTEEEKIARLIEELKSTPQYKPWVDQGTYVEMMKQKNAKKNQRKKISYKLSAPKDKLGKPSEFV